MRQRILGLAVFILFLVPSPALAEGWDFTASATRYAAETQARAATEAASIYGVAIVLAGALIGVGLYLGLRNRK